MAEIRLETAKSPTKTGSSPWKPILTGTIVRLKMMKPIKAERTKVTIPAKRLAQAPLNFSHQVSPFPVPLGHSLISI